MFPSTTTTGIFRGLAIATQIEAKKPCIPMQTVITSWTGRRASNTSVGKRLELHAAKIGRIPCKCFTSHNASSFLSRVIRLRTIVRHRPITATFMHSEDDMTESTAG